jgi:hypothetical protein
MKHGLKPGDEMDPAGFRIIIRVLQDARLKILVIQFRKRAALSAQW